MLRLQRAVGNRAVVSALQRAGRAGQPPGALLRRPARSARILARQSAGPAISGVSVHTQDVSDRTKAIIVNGRKVLTVDLQAGGSIRLSSRFDPAVGPGFDVLRITVHAPAGARSLLNLAAGDGGGPAYQEIMSAAAQRWIIRVETEVAADVEAHIAAGVRVEEVASDPPPLAESGWPVDAPNVKGPPPARPAPKQAAADDAPSPPPDRAGVVLQHMREGRWDTDDLADELTQAEMASLSPTERVDLIAEVGSGFIVGDEDETTIDRLLETTPAWDDGAVAQLLTASPSLLKSLDDAIDGEEYTRYVKALTQILIHARTEQQLEADIESAPELAWTGPGFHPDKATYKIEWTDDGQIRIRRWLGAIGLQMEAAPVVVRPGDLVVVRFVYDEPEADAKAGSFRAMPAAAFVGLVNMQFRRDAWLAVNVGFIVGGVGGVVGGATRLAQLLAALDVAVNAVNIGVDAYRAQIAASGPRGQRFLRAWDTLQMLIVVYGLARVVARLPQAVRNVRQLWNGATGELLEHQSYTAVGDTEKKLRTLEQSVGDVQAEAASDPEAKARIFQTPTVTKVPGMAPGTGSTDKFGNIKISSGGSAADQALALTHEGVHSALSPKQVDAWQLALRTNQKIAAFLEPKLKALQTFRANLGMTAYTKSSLLKYLEEAMAETYAQLKVNGISGLPEGIEFPVKNGYVKLWKFGPVPNTPTLPLAAEVAIGTIVVGGYTYGVYVVATADTSDTSPAPASTGP